MTTEEANQLRPGDKVRYIGNDEDFILKYNQVLEVYCVCADIIHFPEPIILFDFKHINGAACTASWSYTIFERVAKPLKYKKLDQTYLILD